MSSRRPPLLSPEAPEARLGPPHRLTLERGLLGDPHALLEVSPGAAPEAVGEAWRTRVRDCPPERDQARFLQLRAARDHLLEAERVGERELLSLRVPDAAAWGLPERSAAGENRLDPEARLVGELLFRLLLEELI